MEQALDAVQEKEFILPHVPEGKRIIPNDMIRSSLFNISNHNCKREYLKERKLYSFQSTEITYTGEELRQDDEDIWLQLIYLASNARSEKVECRPYTFLKHIKWPQRTQYRDKLKDCLTRMSATTIKIYNTDFQQGIGFSLVRKFEWNDSGESLKEWKIWLEPEVVKLFQAIGRMYTKVHWDQRMKLKPLAKWLHAFYSSHAEPQAIFILKLLQLSGSKTKNLKHFKEILRAALIELIKVGFLEHADIDQRNYLHVIRKKSTYKRVEMNDV